MRELTVQIYARAGTTDFTYTFNSKTAYDPSSLYQFISANLNYSILSSSITGTLVLSLNDTIAANTVIRSGQPLQITDNGEIIFQGDIIACDYRLMPMDERSQGGFYGIYTIAPSIYQLTLTPMIFDAAQAAEITLLTDIDVISLLAGVTQLTTIDQLTQYMISNTDYLNVFKHTSITTKGIHTNPYVMTSAGQPRDSVLRMSLDVYNVVFFQQEDGKMIIRPLSSKIPAPFSVDLSNGVTGNTLTNNVAMLEFNYIENAATTPSIINNYCLLSPELAVAANIPSFVSYKPNPAIYPRISQLSTNGWFVGTVGNAPINNNIISNPTLFQIFQGYKASQDQYLITSGLSNILNNEFGQYMELVTAKELGAALTSFIQLQGTISLDDPFLPTTGMNQILGTILQIQNSDMNAGLIATYSRSYSVQGSYLTFNAVPLGSCTGFWQNVPLEQL